MKILTLIKQNIVWVLLLPIASMIGSSIMAMEQPSKDTFVVLPSILDVSYPFIVNNVISPDGKIDELFKILKKLKDNDSPEAHKIIGKIYGYVQDRADATTDNVPLGCRAKAFGILEKLYSDWDSYRDPKERNSLSIYTLINNALLLTVDYEKIQPFPFTKITLTDEEKADICQWNPQWSALHTIYKAARWRHDANAHGTLNLLKPLFAENKRLNDLWAQNITRYETLEETVSRQGNPYIIRASDMLRYYRRPLIATTGILAAIAAVRFYSPATRFNIAGSFVMSWAHNGALNS